MADSWTPCDGAAMVPEVTSTRPEADREAKRRCCARAGIPPYLFVEPWEAGPTRATVITYVNPAVAVAAGVLFLDEPPGGGRSAPPLTPGTMVDTADEPGGRPRGAP